MNEENLEIDVETKSNILFLVFLLGFEDSCDSGKKIT